MTAPFRDDRPALEAAKRETAWMTALDSQGIADRKRRGRGAWMLGGLVVIVFCFLVAVALAVWLINFG